MKKNYTGMCAAVVFSILVVVTTEIFALSSGYVLTGAYGGVKTVLLDSSGNTVFSWDHSKLPNRLNGYSCYLLKSGNLLRTAIVPESQVISSMAPRQGIIEEIDKSGNVVWRYTLADDTCMLHHDMKPMPNGHILAVAFVYQTKSEIAAAKVDTNLVRGMMGTKYLLSEKIIEIDPTAAGGPKVVWEWRIFDHVVRADSAAAHPELISGSISQTLFQNQWVHLNGIDYNEKLDMILFSSRVFSECYIIDHSTTIQEAAGHTGGKRKKGGDILYRWGNPANYKASGATKINVLHCPNWIPEGYPGAGNIIFFHNNVVSTMPGAGGASQSQIVEIKTPIDAEGNFPRTSGQPFGPTQPTWVFAPTDSFNSFAMSSAFRLKNGNTLAHLAYPSNGGAMNISGNSMLVEIDNNKKILWKFSIALKGEAVEAKNPQSYNPAKVMYYDKDYEGIKKLLSTSVNKNNNTFSTNGKRSTINVNVANGLVHFTGVSGSKIDVFTMQGKHVTSAIANNNSFEMTTRSFSSGLYYVKVTSENHGMILKKFSIVH